MRTAGIKRLVEDVLDQFPMPYDEHVIDVVFSAIEHKPEWLQRYNDECERLGKVVVNNWGAWWTATLLDKTGERQVPAVRSTLIASYSILDVDARTLRKPSETEALEAMSAYYRKFKDKLPKSIRDHRDEILALLKKGVPVEQAFDRVREL